MKYKKNFKTFLPCVSFAMVGACAVHPSVHYTKIDKSSSVNSDTTDSYFLSSSMITITNASNGAGSSNTRDEPVVSSIPIEYQKFKIGIAARSSWLGTVDTTVNISKIDNTSLVKEVGVQVTDNRVSTIKAIGSTIATLVPLLGFSSPSSLDANKLPWSSKVYNQIESNPDAADSGKSLQLADGVMMTLGPLPPDALPIELLPRESTSAFVYAACRDARIEFEYTQTVGKTKQVSKHNATVKVADPRYIEMVSFPVKGKISTHSQCGVSVTTEADTGVTTGTDIVSALATQGKAIKDAIDASNKSKAAAGK